MKIDARLDLEEAISILEEALPLSSAGELFRWWEARQGDLEAICDNQETCTSCPFWKDVVPLPECRIPWSAMVNTYWRWRDIPTPPWDGALDNQAAGEFLSDVNAAIYQLKTLLSNLEDQDAR